MDASRLDLDHLTPEQKRALLRELIQRPPSRSSEQPLSQGQRPLWLQYELDPANPVYNLSSLWRARSAVDVAALRSALERLVRRHAALRTTFHADPGEPRQQIHERLAVPLQTTDVRGWDDERLAACLHDELARPFDLSAGPAFRAHLLSLSPTEHLLQFAFHHIVFDHWSLTPLIADLQGFYAAASGGTPAPVATGAAQYTDYIHWQTAMLAGSASAPLWAYWDSKLGGGVPALDLPFDRGRPAAQTHHSASCVLPIDEATVDRLTRFARERGATPYMVLLSAFHVLMHRWSGQDDFVIVTPTSGRERPEFRDVVGFFVNPVAIRASLSRDPAFEVLLDRVRRAVTEALDHAGLPFPMLVERYRQDSGAGQSPLLQVAFTWDRLARGSADTVAAAALPLQFVSGGQIGSMFDLDLILFEQESGIEAQWRYSTELFDRETVESMARHFITILDGIVDAPSRRVSELPLIEAAERQRLLSAWNPAPAPEAPLRPATLVSRFEAQVERSPDSVAVVCGGDRVTYRVVNERANQLAHVLRSRGVGVETTVALYVERSAHLPIAVLGILKAGAAYVPVDPQYPPDRIQFMLADAQVRAVVTDTALTGALPNGQYDVVCVDDLPADTGASNPQLNIDPEKLAYIIYTSGSTGRPKGVGVSHRNVMRLFESTDAWFRFGPSDVWTLFHSAAFDFSVWELWGALLYGGRLVVVPFWVSRSPDSFRALLSDEGVTVLNQTPSAFRQLMEADRHSGAGPLRVLRYVIFGGEALDVRALQPWVERHGADRPLLVNMYGITETTVHVTFRPLARADVFAGSRSVIGQAIPDLAVYVLDSTFEPVPVGLRGELFVGGAGVARGYVSHPRLTAERFVPDPFSGIPGARLYRSGDIARRLRDGDLEYLGRGDEQVKVRGFRIELGEIAQALRAHPVVRDVFVEAATSDGDMRIAAFVVPDAGTAGAVRRLSAWERSGRLHGRTWCELPNGLAIVELNRNETDFLYGEIFGGERYLRHGVALGPGACVFDVGANIGMFSLHIASRYPDATIYAFEPIPQVYDVLALNTELHGLDIRPMPLAVAERAGGATFTYYPRVSIFSGRFADAGDERAVVQAFIRNQHAGIEEEPALLDELLQDRLVAETVHCPMTTISDVMRERGIGVIDLLKVDVEKSELGVLEGIDRADWPKIRQVIVEVHDEHGRLAAVRSVLERAGFQLTIDQDPMLAGTALYSVYAVREHPAEAAACGTVQRWSSPDRLVADLRQHLGRLLPEYMVPSSIVFLDALPLTSNGKLDRRALPQSVPTRRTSVAARTPLEEQIAAVWRDVLKLESVGVTDDFFALGGHSLSATRMMARVRSISGVNLPLRTIFEAPTVEALSLAIVQQQAELEDPDALRAALAEIERI